MCLTCGCMDAHKAMGDNVTFEDLERIAKSNANTVDETIKVVVQTADLDRGRHPAEYSGSATNE